MADNGRNDGSLAPRRSLNGPILPPPPPDLADSEKRAQEEREKTERIAAQKQAAREERTAQKETQKREREQAKRARAEESARRDEQQKQQKAAATESSRSARSADGAGSQEPQGATAAAAAAGSATRTGSSAAAGSAAPTRRTPGTTRSESVRGERPARGLGGSGRRQGGAARRTRRAQLRLVQVDAWSVMKTSFLLSIALGIVLVVAVAIIMSVLGAAGVWDSINSIVKQAVGGESTQNFDITQYVGLSRVLGLTMLVAVLDVILITAIATLGAFLYNLSAALLGGIEVTLAEDS